jgi:hypothetical protein
MTWLAVLLAPLLGVVPFDPPASDTPPEASAATQTAPEPPAPPISAPFPSRCPQWYAAALDAGWAPAQWRTLDRIMWRESRCQPRATHRNRNRTVDRGLLQVNSIHLPWLARYGLRAADLTTADGALSAGHLLWLRDGWRPWHATR